MATHLDLEEQEQLDEIKHFWKRYGDAITWVLVAVLAVAAAWNGYQYWQRNQAAQAAALNDEIQRVAQAHDPEKLERAFNEMKERFPSTAYAAQAGLLLGKVESDAGKVDVARTALQWVMDKASDPGLSNIARLRLAGLLMDAKEDAQALKLLEPDLGPAFAGLRSDRRADIYALMGNVAQAKSEYLAAYKAFDPQSQYRRLVEVKLNALGVDPVAAQGPTATVETSK